MMTARSNLAVLGALPAFPEPLHVGRPNIGDRGRLLARLNEMLERRWLTNRGPLVEEFERRIAEYVGVKHCIATSNGTIALELLLRAAGLSGEVLVPAFTFIATAHAVRWCGLTPIFCDVDPRDGTLDPEQVEARITPRTTGMIGVHLFGASCNVDRLGEIADRRGLSLFFDAAHAFGVSRRGRMVGSFGRAESFSFHATKIVNCFEGGAVTTDDDRLAETVRLMVNFGFADYDTVVSLGTNGKMSEACGAMGLTSLEGYDGFVEHNRALRDGCREQLAGLTGIEMLPLDNTEQQNYHYLALRIGDQSGLTRDELYRVLWAEGVLARRYFTPGCHRMEPYRSELGERDPRLPVTELLAREVLCLPTGTSVSLRNMATICQIIRTALEQAGQVRGALAAAAPGPKVRA